MAITINSKVNALRAIRRLDQAQSKLSAAFERLSSGSRINQASDDAAGLGVALQLQADTRIRSQAIRNVNDGISFLNVADGATQQLKTILFRLRELSTQASNGVYSDKQRSSLDKEAQALQLEYNRIIESTEFNGVSVFDETFAVQAGRGKDAVLFVGASAAGGGITRTAGDGTFQARQVVGSVGSPRAMALGDLNGDGINDLAITRGSGSGASILIGNSDGTFQTPVSYAMGADNQSVLLGDFNGDGILDLVTGGNTGNTLSIRLGVGDGTFQAYQVLAGGGNVSGLKAVDINGDGKLDIIGANTSSTSVVIFTGNGDGTFSAFRTHRVGTFPSDVELGDVNGDGILDLVNGRSGGFVDISLGNGNGTFKASQTLTVPSGVTIPWIQLADVDGDNILDIVTVDNSGSSFDGTSTVLLGNGNGTFKAGMSFKTGQDSRFVATADLNGDGIADIVTADTNGNSISILFGNGNGTFLAKQSFATGSLPQSLLITDMNKDGALDIIVGDWGSSTVSAFLGNPVMRSSAGSGQAGLTPLSGISVATKTQAFSAQESIDSYLDELNLISGSIGVGLSRLSFASSTLSTSVETFKAAESRITDADIAADSAQLVSSSILQQAAAAVLAHATKEPELALRLLQD